MVVREHGVGCFYCVLRGGGGGGLVYIWLVGRLPRWAVLPHPTMIAEKDHSYTRRTLREARDAKCGARLRSAK